MDVCSPWKYKNTHINIQKKTSLEKILFDISAPKKGEKEKKKIMSCHLECRAQR